MTNQLYYAFSYSHVPTASFFFFFNDTPTTEIYTLSLHDALPISRTPPVAWRRRLVPARHARAPRSAPCPRDSPSRLAPDRKSTRLNSSHRCISYAVFCLKKKKTKETHIIIITLHRIS